MNATVAIFYSGQGEFSRYQRLSEILNMPLYVTITPKTSENFFLTYRENSLTLINKKELKKGGLRVNIFPRAGEQHSYPAPRKSNLAKALGKKTLTIIDATTGWGQDALFMFRMGYQLHCFERSPLMSVLLKDAFLRLTQLSWVQQRQLKPPSLKQGNAIELFVTLTTAPDCIYLDPMFPPKRRQSALSKKPIQVLQQLLGHDDDKTQLFKAAMSATAKRVVVKSPLYAKPLGGIADESFTGKLLRYDVYFKT